MNTTAQGKKQQKENRDAIAMLIADHEKVKKLFNDFQKMRKSGTDDEKEEIVEQICTELSMHADAEEAIFYPAARAAIGDDDLMDAAEVEHDCARDLIDQLQTMDPSEELYDARVKVLGELVVRHIDEEQDIMFPKAKNAKMDMDDLGSQIQDFKENWDGQQSGVIFSRAKTGDGSTGVRTPR